MCAAAKLNAVAAHINHAHDIAVFLAKERHCALLSCRINAHFLRNNGIACEDSFIDQSFHLFDFIRCHSGEMGEVETQSVCADIGAGLLNVCPQNSSQCLLQQMGCGVVSCGSHSVFFVDFCTGNIANGNGAFLYHALMRDFAADYLHAVCYLNYAVCGFDDTMIANLTAAFCVEGSSVEEYHNGILCLCAICNGIVCNQSNDFCIRYGIHIIACKFCFQIGRQLIVYGYGCAHVALAASCLTRTILLCLHFLRKSLLIHAHACFFQNFLCQINREAIGIIQAEGFFAAHHGFACGFHFLHILLEDFHTLIDSLIEAVLLDGKNLKDIILLIHQLRICFAAAGDNSLGKLCKEFTLNTQKLAMARRTTQQSSQYIAAPFVGGQNAVCGHDCNGTDMVCDDTNGNVNLMLLAIFHACLLTNRIADIFYGIHIENGIYALHDGCHTFQTHAGIYVFMIQLGIGAILMRIELCQNQIPEFHVSVAVTANATGRAVAAIFGTAVIIDFRTGATGTCTMLPEVILLAKLLDSVPRQTNLFMPDFACFVILLIDGDIQLILRDFQPFGNKLPRPRDDFVLKIIAKGEIAQHFKKCAVARGFADIINIPCTDTFLTGCDTLTGGCFLPCEVCLHGCHTGVNQQQALVVTGNDGKGFQTQMVFGFKELQKQLSDFVYTEIFHSFSSLKR